MNMYYQIINYNFSLNITTSLGVVLQQALNRCLKTSRHNNTRRLLWKENKLIYNVHNKQMFT